MKSNSEEAHRITNIIIFRIQLKSRLEISPFSDCVLVHKEIMTCGILMSLCIFIYVYNKKKVYLRGVFIRFFFLLLHLSHELCVCFLVCVRKCYIIQIYIYLYCSVHMRWLEYMFEGFVSSMYSADTL